MILAVGLKIWKQIQSKTCRNIEKVQWAAKHTYQGQSGSFHNSGK
jgi:hypothetical protein